MPDHTRPIRIKGPGLKDLIKYHSTTSRFVVTPAEVRTLTK